MKTLLSLICLLLPLTVMAQDVALEPITVENADQIEQINIIGYGYVEDMAYTPDGEQIVLAGSLGLIFYDAELYEHVPADRWFVPEETVNALAFSPDGSVLATISGNILANRDENDILRLWDVETREIVSERIIPHVSIFEIIFSPSATELVLINRWDNNAVLLWDTSDPANVVELEPEQWASVQQRWYAPDAAVWSGGYATTYSPDGNTIAFVTSDGITTIDAITQEERYTVQPNEYYAPGELLITPDSRLLIGFASAEWSMGSVDIWDLATGEKLFEYTQGRAAAFALHPTESSILFKRYFGPDIYEWDPDTENSVAVFSHYSLWQENAYTDADFNQDGSILAVVHGAIVQFWDVMAGVKARSDLYIEQPENTTQPVGFSMVEFSPDGKLLALKGSALDGSEGVYVHLWDMNTSEFVGRIKYDGTLYDIAFSPDGSILATYHGIQSDISPNVVYLWDLEKTLDIGTLDEPLASIWTANLGPFSHSSVTFSPDGQVIALSGVDPWGTGFELWNVASVLEARFNQRPLDPDLENTAQLKTFNGFGPMAFSPEGDLLAANSTVLECYIVIYDVNTGELENCLTDNAVGTDSPLFIQFLSDSLLVSGAESRYSAENTSKTIRLWDIEGNQLITELEGHFENYNDIAISPDSRVIVSAGGGYSCSECPSYDGALRVWSILADD
ncbi:MAG: hypothetical protein CL607_06775 [Anaerolineaceae bacterium]|nr:hypothetical protein [Anaerolineaceae bacterium]